MNVKGGRADIEYLSQDIALITLEKNGQVPVHVKPVIPRLGNTVARYVLHRAVIPVKLYRLPVGHGKLHGPGTSQAFTDPGCRFTTALRENMRLPLKTAESWLPTFRKGLQGPGPWSFPCCRTASVLAFTACCRTASVLAFAACCRTASVLAFTAYQCGQRWDYG